MNQLNLFCRVEVEKIRQPEQLNRADKTAKQKLAIDVDYAKFWEYSNRLRINTKECFADNFENMDRKKEILDICGIPYEHNNGSRNEFNIDVIFWENYKKAKELYGHGRR